MTTIDDTKPQHDREPTQPSHLLAVPRSTRRSRSAQPSIIHAALAALKWIISWIGGRFPARIGSVRGLPIELHASAVMLVTSVGALDGARHAALLVIVLLCVLMHELGHAVVAQRIGAPVTSIQLNLFGGLAVMRVPRDPRDELVIALAGPVVSAGLSAIGLVAWSICHVHAFAWFFTINAILAGFNLVPALPMDGGRILRALLVPRLGFLHATRVAVRVARVIVLTMGVAGLTGYYMLLFLAPVLWLMGTRELAVALRAEVEQHERAEVEQHERAARHEGSPCPGHAPAVAHSTTGLAAKNEETWHQRKDLQ
jgi:Zn-dependent protease